MGTTQTGRNKPDPTVPTSRRPVRGLGAELAELERTDPAVRAAAASYDRMVEDLTRRVPRARFKRGCSGGS